jgi:hypothetical protein
MMRTISRVPRFSSCQMARNHGAQRDVPGDVQTSIFVSWMLFRCHGLQARPRCMAKHVPGR